MNSKELWVFLFICGMVLFNWPFMSIFEQSLPFYLFGTWIAFTFCAGIFSAMVKRNGDG